MTIRFTVKNKIYRIVDGLLVDELQVKEKNGRFGHVAYVRDLMDALRVINKQKRIFFEPQQETP